MVNRRLLTTAGAAAVLTLTVGVGSAAGASHTVMNLRLNEAAGATVAHDASGNGNNGTIGKRVAMNGSYARFPYADPGATYGRAQLITIPDDSSVDPGRATFTIELRYRTTHAYGNVLQKGQATSAGGQVKLQQPKGKLTCMFKTPVGRATAGSGTKRLNDGKWHAVKCVRTTSSVTMYVDGVRTGHSDHNTGNLDNSLPWTIGGKPSCNGTTVDCDYFDGDVDYVTFTKG